MISFQRLLGQEDHFCALLEASAQEACNAVAQLKTMFDQSCDTAMLQSFAQTRRKEKQITEEITEKLMTTFVTPMEREDIEALAESLYKIPKTIEKFAERYRITAAQIQDTDFGPQVVLMDKAVHLVLNMIQAMRAGRNHEGIKGLQQALQQIESDADRVLLELSRRFYEPGFPPIKAIILKDLFNLNEKVVDRCRDAGNVVSLVLFKNS
jgi:uncharacterized protein Yka (UPF0111/DUF47 family)